MSAEVGQYQTALGIVGFYLLAGITGSFYLHRRIGYRAWRAIHYLTFAAFALSLVHSATAGSDSGSWWGTALYWSTAIVTAMATWWRFAAAGARGSASRPGTWRPVATSGEQA